ncbi:MAG: DUF885 family protein [Clostridium sp.]|nr:DUF885 family protein [Clostridium sp.]
MRKKISLLIILLFSFNLTFISCDSRTPEETQADFDKYINETFKEAFGEDSFSTHFFLEYPENYDIKQDKVSIGHYKSDLEDCDLDEDIKELKSFNYDNLTKKQQILYDKLLYHCELQEDFADCKDLSTPLGRNKSVIANTTSNFTEYAFYEEKDINDYLELLKQLPDYYDEAIDFAKKQIDNNVIPTDTALDTNIKYCNNYSNKKDNVFIVSFNDKIDELTNIDSTKKQELKKQNEEIVTTLLIPKYREISNTLTSLKGSNTDPKGLANINGGKNYYEALVKSYTGSSKSPSKLLSSLNSRINNLILEFTKISSKNPNILNELNDVKVNYNTPDSALNKLKNEITTDYPSLPNVNYKAKYLPEELEMDGVIAYYLSPQIDNPNNNIIKVNKNAVSDKSLSLFSTLAHEGYPGHLYQRNYYKNTNPYNVEYLLSYLGYTEGWATYAELDSFNMCDLNDDNLIRLLQIDNLLNNYLTCAVDIMVNYNNDSLSDIESYLSTYYGANQAESIASSIYDFVISDPACMLSYGVGYIELTDLQDCYKDNAGEKYNEEDFLKKVLDIGPCSFDTLKKYILD